LLALCGVVAFFLYNYLSMAASASYNPIFLLYVGAFSASFFALVVAVRAAMQYDLAQRILPSFPYRSLIAFFLVSGVALTAIWLEPIVTGLVQGTYPDLLMHYTTVVTWALDLALIAPLLFVAAGLLWRRDPLGYVVTAVLLGVVSLLGPAIIGMTIGQVLAGWAFTTQEIVVFIVSFLVMSALGIYLLVRMLRGIDDGSQSAWNAVA
jgi:hypothetical protein